MIGFLFALLGAVNASSAIRHKRSMGLERRYTPEMPDGDITVFKCAETYKPKVLVVSLFEPELEVWHENLDFVHNITVPGLSPLFPHVYCTEDYEICNVATGEGEVNAATTMMSVATYPKFDLSQTYILTAGIAGCSPYEGSLGSASFSRFTVQVALEYEIDSREMPENWTTGYFAYGTDGPGMYPGNWYGTEVFEFNEALRDRAAELASSATLNDTDSMKEFRVQYNSSEAKKAPGILKCDVATSDVYYTGPILSSAFSNVTSMLTNGTGVYCMSAQEDSGIAEAVLRAARFGLVDYSRLVVMRTCSDYDQGPPGMGAAEYFTQSDQGSAFPAAISNIWNAGSPFVLDVVKNWDNLYANNTFKPENYVGDVFGYLGGEPDFGIGSYYHVEYVAA